VCRMLAYTHDGAELDVSALRSKFRVGTGFLQRIYIYPAHLR
jgi:hypothetical protein